MILDFFMAELAFKKVKPQDRIQYLWLKFVRENKLEPELKSLDHMLEAVEGYYQRTNGKRKWGTERV